MNPLIQFLEQANRAALVNEDGKVSSFHLLPPMSEPELTAFASTIPCPLPPEIEELLRFASGFSGTWLQDIKFASEERGSPLPDDIFRNAVPLAYDGAGNCWIVDLTSESRSWGPIFYACHDAPVIVYQTDSLLHFVEEVLKEGKKPRKSEIGEVRGPLSDQIWKDNPGVLSFSHCAASPDEDLRAFATSLDEAWQFIDLRNPVLGDGFSWGRYGPRTPIRRFGEKRVFAYQKRAWGRRVLDGLR